MKHLKSFDKLNENALQNKLIPIFPENTSWKLSDSWEGNNGDLNFSFSNGPFEITAEFWDPTKTYSVGFRELGDKYLVPQEKRYQTDNLKDLTEVKKEMSKMMDFLEQYSK